MDTYSTICVPLTTSSTSRQAMKLAASLGQSFDADISGLQLDERSAQRERERRLLDMLPAAHREAGRGKNSDEQGLDPAVGAWAADVASSAAVTFEHRALSGRPIDALVEALRAEQPDLLVVGAYAGSERPTEDDAEGVGVGPTCERLVRRAHVDTLIVKNLGDDAQARDTILVGIDGSHQSYAGLTAAIDLAKRFDKRVEAVAVYDPYIHYTLFNGIVTVLTDEASRVFKFKDQEKLHEEIIDTGLAKIYQAHLEVAREVAAEQDVDLDITLLDGKAFRKVLQQTRKRPPWLLVIGRIGVHSGDEMDIGATTENLIRKAPCNLLVTSRKHVPSVDVQAEASVEWTPEAREKMERVPDFVKGVATTAIIRWAMERGHSIITEALINQAMGDLMPPAAAQAMGYVAEEVAIASDNMREGKTFICPACGYAAKDFRPVACPVCKTVGEKFDEINRQVLENLGELDRGHLDEEETFDGEKLLWQTGAGKVLRRVPSGYERRRAKARIEKNARVRGLTAITEEFALDMVKQDLADTSYLSERGEVLKIELQNVGQDPDDETPREREESPLAWTDAAWKRICRVPEGFMRSMTRERVEQFAAAQDREHVNLALCEEGIAEGRKMMAEMLANYGKPEKQ